MNLSAYDNLLTLLRNAINGESRVLPSLADWPQLMAQARIHGVEPLAYDAALRLPADQQPDKQLAVRMKQVCLYQMQQQQIWLPRIRKAVEALRSAGVEPVLLKGFGLADLYPKPYLRSWGDADIWVGVSNYHAGCKAIMIGAVVMGTDPGPRQVYDASAAFRKAVDDLPPSHPQKRL